MIDQDIKKFVLRRLLQKNGDTLTAAEIKLAIRSAFSSVTHVEGDLDNYLVQMESNNLVAMAKNEFEEIIFGLTDKGRIAAQKLIRLT